MLSFILHQVLLTRFICVQGTSESSTHEFLETGNSIILIYLAKTRNMQVFVYQLIESDYSIHIHIAVRYVEDPRQFGHTKLFLGLKENSTPKLDIVTCSIFNGYYFPVSAQRCWFIILILDKSILLRISAPLWFGVSQNTSAKQRGFILSQTVFSRRFPINICSQKIPCQFVLPTCRQACSPCCWLGKT